VHSAVKLLIMCDGAAAGCVRGLPDASGTTSASCAKLLISVITQETLAVRRCSCLAHLAVPNFACRLQGPLRPRSAAGRVCVNLQRTCCHSSAGQCFGCRWVFLVYHTSALCGLLYGGQCHSCCEQTCLLVTPPPSMLSVVTDLTTPSLPSPRMTCARITGSWTLREPQMRCWQGHPVRQKETKAISHPSNESRATFQPLQLTVL
jgi:hypothetical protein